MGPVVFLLLLSRQLGARFQRHVARIVRHGGRVFRVVLGPTVDAAFGAFQVVVFRHVLKDAIHQTNDDR